MKEQISILKKSQEKEHEEKKSRETEMSRRDFLKQMGTIAGIFALQGFHGVVSAKERSKKSPISKRVLEKRKSQEKIHPLAEQWEELVRAAVKNLEARPGLYWRGKEAKEVRDALPQFDIREFLHALSEKSGIPERDINASLNELFIESQDPDHPFRAGEMIPQERSILLYISPFLFKEGGVLDQERFFSVIRHELTHAVSIDYEATENRRMMPWVGPQSPFLIFLSPGFYEGATEFIAMRTGPGEKYKKDDVRAYSMGITLSAYVIAHLVGEREFIHAYLKKDPLLLARAMNEKIGEDASLMLTQPLHIGATLREKGSLDIFHNIFKQEYTYDLTRVKDILRKAWEDGIEEMIAYRTDGGAKITFNLFPAFSTIMGTEGKYFSVTAAAEGPAITRFEKHPYKESGQKNTYVDLPKHHVSVIMRQFSMKKSDKDANIRFAAESLRNVLLDPDPSFYREQSLLILGISDQVEKELALLNRMPAFSSQEFHNQWLRVQDALQEDIVSALKEVYSLAGVKEDQVIPYQFSPLSSAE